MIAIPACVVCVAPADGRARALVERGVAVEPGQVVAVVDSQGHSAPVRAPVFGRVGGALAGRGQTVSRGEAVVWLLR